MFNFESIHNFLPNPKMLIEADALCLYFLFSISKVVKIIPNF